MSTRPLIAITAALLWAACAVSPTGNDGRLQVGFLLLEGVYDSELMAPYDVFHHAVEENDRRMRVFTVGRSTDPVRTFEGLRITPDYSMRSAPKIDILVVPSTVYSMSKDLEDRDLIEWVAERGANAQFVVSVCDGAFVLGQAGLLHERRATTFPGDIAELRKRYPDAEIVEDVSFVADGPIVTGVGGARSYDPALYLVERLYGRAAARTVGKGLVIDWQLDKVEHEVAEASFAGSVKPRCFLPGDRIPEDVVVEDAEAKPVRLRDLVRPDDKGLVLCLIAGGEAIDVKKRGGLWCEDSFNDLPLLRHLRLDYADKGIRFVAIACPPVYHEDRFGYATGSFFGLASDDPIYQTMRKTFVDATLALVANDGYPFDTVLFDPRFRLLANPAHGEPKPVTGPRPQWQGRFKWHRDTQMYGTPTLWVFDRDMRVVGEPFYMNVYESPGRQLRYTAGDVGARLDRLLR